MARDSLLSLRNFITFGPKWTAYRSMENRCQKLYLSGACFRTFVLLVYWICYRINRECTLEKGTLKVCLAVKLLL